MSTAGCDALTVQSDLSRSESDDHCRLQIPTVDRWFFRLKGLADRLCALALLVPALPLIGLVVLLVRVTSKGPGIYSQKRVGRGGRIFTMYKIRSMRIDAEGKTGPTWAGVAHDPRVTPLGYWLRKLHLDELPQIFNVLYGQMSLVGPRPERPEFVSILADQIPGYVDRLAIAPGITGLAQVNLPPDTDLDSVRRKLLLDGEYIRTAGFLLDIRILLCTALRLLYLRGGHSVSLLGLERKVELAQQEQPSSTGESSGGPTSLREVLAPVHDHLVKISKPLANGAVPPPNRRHAGSKHADANALRDTVTFDTTTVIEDNVESPVPQGHTDLRRVKAK